PLPDAFSRQSFSANRFCLLRALLGGARYPSCRSQRLVPGELACLCDGQRPHSDLSQVSIVEFILCADPALPGATCNRRALHLRESPDRFLAPRLSPSAAKSFCSRNSFRLRFSVGLSNARTSSAFCRRS